MTPEEGAVINGLATAWNAFLKLPKQHDDDRREFRHSLHQAQYLILKRPAVRQLDREDEARQYPPGG